jgi:zinc protease
MGRRFQLLVVLLGILLWAMPVAATGDEAARLGPDLYRTTLANGLTLLVRQTPGLRAATVQIWVRAGSAYEEPGEAGITHLIEHMIFKGTPDRGPGELAGAVEGLGGQINAYTSHDQTVYYATLPARHWETALAVLADAVWRAAFDARELEREKQVVLEEIRMRQDQPATRLFRKLMALAYTRHPYGRPVIGTKESVSALGREDLLRYRARHYRPDNMAVVVAGDVSFAAVRDRVAALAGTPAAAGEEAPSLPVEPFPQAARLFVEKEQVRQGHLAVALPICAFADADAAVLDVIASILGDGESSRLYRELRDRKGLVYGIGASAFTPRDPGLMEVRATLDPGRGREALSAVLEELFRLRYGAVDKAELERAKRNLEAGFVFNLERVEGQARVMGSFQFLTGDPRPDDYLARVRAVTREQIARVASAWFLPERIVAGFLVPEGSDPGIDPTGFETLVAAAEQAARNAALPPAAGAATGGVQRFVLANGIRLLVQEDARVPTAALRVVFPGGLRGETPATSGVFAFLSELLTKGTSRMPARELAEKVADMAASLNGFTGKNTFGLQADFLSRFLAPVMDLVRDVIRSPAFAAGEAEKLRPELLARLRQQEDSLPSLAFREFNAALFGNHPYGLNPLGEAGVLSRLGAGELRVLYERHARPERMVISVAGDVRAEAVRSLVADLFGDWQAGPAPEAPEAISPPGAPAAPGERTVERDKEQVHLVTGFAGTTLKSPDRYALEVLDTALSGQSGRLFTELRDRQSLAYRLSAFSLMGIDTGSFGIYLATRPDRKEEALRAVWAELDRLRVELLSEAELRKAQNVLTGRYELGLQTNGSRAMDAALNETYGLGLDFGGQYVRAVGQVTAEAVREAARKYIRPERSVQVSVGAKAPGAGAAGPGSRPGPP